MSKAPGKILLTAHKFFPQHKAGTEVLTLKVAQELQRRGYRVLVVAANPPDLDARRVSGPETSDFEWEGVPVHIIEEPLRLKDYSFSCEFSHPTVARHFDGILADFQPDILHIFHAQNLSAEIIHCAKKRNIPVVFSSTDFWFICPIVQLIRPNGDICRGPSAKATNCLTCYTPKLFPPVGEFNEALAKRGGRAVQLLDKLPRPLKTLGQQAVYRAYLSSKLLPAAKATMDRPKYLKEAANLMDAIMVPTNLMRELFVRNGIRQELIQKVPFGIDTANLVPYTDKPSCKTLRVGFIGTIFRHKGVDLLIRAFQALPKNADAVLRIYGDRNQFPDYTAELDEIVRSKPECREKISFPGSFPNADLGSVLQDLDVLVVPSRWYENTPLVMQSALATKTPLIVTNLGGMSELVKEGETGLLFPLNDVKGLTSCLLKVLKDRSLIDLFRSNIAAERTVPTMVDDIESTYERVLKTRLKNAQDTH